MSIKRNSKLRPLLDEADDHRSVYAIQFLGATRDVPLYKFVLATPSEFYSEDLIKNKVSTACEVIQENQPCHMYLDIDAGGKTREDVIGYWECLKPVFIAALRKKVNDDDIETIVLDSSSSKKGSLHVILKCKSFVFKNNIHMGVFVGIIGRTVSEVPTLSDAFQYVDTAVYSKNRLMRMWKNTKVGQTRYLEWTGVEFTYENWRKTHICARGSTAKQIELQDKYFKTNLTSATSSGWVPPFMDTIVRFLESILLERFRGGRIHEIKCIVPEQLTYTLNADVKKCPIMKREHGSNHLYFVIHVRAMKYRIKCRSTHCSRNGLQRYFKTIKNESARRREMTRVSHVTKNEPFPLDIQKLIAEWFQRTFKVSNVQT
jgi:hypothetical protein